jgi:polyisoprenoid-binding protein YceI
MRAVWLAILIAFQTPAILPVGTFRLEPGGGRVEFVMRDNRGGFTGATEQVEGTATVTQTDAESFSASVEARVDARTLETGSRIRDGQMRRDFLQTDRHPLITFRGTAESRERLTGGAVRARLRGTLTIRGASREIDMPVTAVALADEYRVNGEATIRLSDYGIPIPRFLVFVAEDAVVVKVRARFRRAP